MRHDNSWQVIHDAYANGLTHHAMHGVSRQSNGLMCFNLEAGRVMGLVEAQAPAVRDWLLFAYGPGDDNDALRVRRVADTLWLHLQASAMPTARMTKRRRAALPALCVMVAVNYRAKRLGRKEAIYSSKAMAEAMEVPARNFKRDFMPWAWLLEVVLEQWDCEGRGAIDLYIRKVNERERCQLA